ncbi:serine/threonine-protein kinase [Nocardia sp. NPDC004722]
MRTLADRYQITSAIGRGGMGEVWSGKDLRLNRKVAIKLVASEFATDIEARRRFNREARITARLSHPGVPAVYDFGADGELFLVMELVSGDTIGMLVDERGGLPVNWATCITAQVCAVLAAAHDVDLIHRDVKPGNLVLSANGLVKLIDFGAATSLRAGDYSVITAWGDIPASLGYMAPELLEGGSAGRASDLYSVGCLLYELLTGTRAFETGVDRTVSPPCGRDMPTELKELTFQLLDPDPARRLSDARTVHSLLKPWIGDRQPIPGWIGRDISGDPAQMYVDAASQRSDARATTSRSGRVVPPG